MQKEIRGGKSSELMVAGELVRRGIDVYFPCVDDQGIDMILTGGPPDRRKYFEVQIKSVKGYNRIVGLRAVSDKPDNFLLIIHYRHDNRQDEFFWLTRDQAREHAVEAGRGDLVFNAPERERYNEQNLDELAKRLESGNLVGVNQTG